MLILQFLPFQTGQCAQTHFHDRIGLFFREPEALLQTVFCFLCSLAAADDADHFIDVIQRREQTLYNVVSFLCLIQIVLCTTGDHIFLML